MTAFCATRAGPLVNMPALPAFKKEVGSALNTQYRIVAVEVAAFEARELPVA